MDTHPDIDPRYTMYALLQYYLEDLYPAHPDVDPGYTMYALLQYYHETCTLDTP